MQAREMFMNMKEISFEGLLENETEIILNAGVSFGLNKCKSLLVKNMKDVVKYITNMIHELDKARDKFLLLYILDKHNIQIFQSDDDMSCNLGYMVFGRCEEVEADFSLCDKNQRGASTSYEYRKRKDNYYVRNYGGRYESTKFTRKQLEDTFDFKLKFGVLEKDLEAGRGYVDMMYIVRLDFVQKYEDFLTDIEKLLDYLKL